MQVLPKLDNNRMATELRRRSSQEEGSKTLTTRQVCFYFSLPKLFTSSVPGETSIVHFFGKGERKKKERKIIPEIESSKPRRYDRFSKIRPRLRMMVRVGKSRFLFVFFICFAFSAPENPPGHLQISKHFACSSRIVTISKGMRWKIYVVITQFQPTYQTSLQENTKPQVMSPFAGGGDSWEG